MNNDSERIKHPSFGQIRFSRVSGQANFYGSELESNNYISMEVSTSEMERTLTKDWHYGERESVLRLIMTSNQFAEMITSLNHGSGIPCTLERINGVGVEPYEKIESRKTFVHRKFKDRMKEFSERLSPERSELIEKIQSSKMGKKDKSDLLFLINNIKTELENNIPYFAECFQETMDDIVVEAKTEIESAIQHKITMAGIESLKSENLLNK